SLYLYDKKAADDLAALAAKAQKLRATKPVEDFIDALTEVPGKAPVTHLFRRGDPDQPGEAVAPGHPAVLANHGLGAIPEKDPARPRGGGGWACAGRLVWGRPPRRAGVIATRVGMPHLGRGIVPTPGDFGKLGEPPTPPELLDWLASEFMRDRSLKRLHRLI